MSELRSVIIELMLDDEEAFKKLAPLVDEAVMGLKSVGDSAKEMYGFDVFATRGNPFTDMEIVSRMLIPRVGRVTICNVESGPIAESILTYMVNTKTIKSWRYADE